MKRTNDFLAVALILLGAISYGLVSAVFKLAVTDGWSVDDLTFYQLLSGAVMLWLLLGVMRLRRNTSSLASTWKAWLMLAVIGIVGLALTTIFYNETLVRLDASLGIVLLFQFTWITILLESLRKRKWPTKQEWVAVIFIAIGTILAARLLEQDFSEISGIGVMYGLLAAVMYSLFFFLAGFLPDQLDPIAKSAVMSTASAIFIVLMLAPTASAITVSGPLIGWGIGLGFLGSALPFFCFNYGIPKVGSSLAALLGSMELPAAVIAASVFLDEPMSFWQGAGIVLILAGIMATQSKERQPVSVGKEGEE